MKRLLLLLLLLVPIASAATRDNDDSCDIAVLPAATLLLPYFEVDLNDSSWPHTAFSITNVSNVDQIAHVTLWTDRAWPLFGFDIYLTGYDVQRIDLFDVLARGVIAPDAGTGTAIATSRRRTPTSDPNPRLDLSACGRLPGTLESETVRRLQDVFLEGRIDDCVVVGSADGRHAIGYATIDVVGACGAAGPADPDYWTKYLRYDNVLTGESIYDNEAAPLVHIRAVPEGGTAEQRRAGGPAHLLCALSAVRRAGAGWAPAVAVAVRGAMDRRRDRPDVAADLARGRGTGHELRGRRGVLRRHGPRHLRRERERHGDLLDRGLPGTVHDCRRRRPLSATPEWRHGRMAVPRPRRTDGPARRGHAELGRGVDDRRPVPQLRRRRHRPRQRLLAIGAAERGVVPRRRHDRPRAGSRVRARRRRHRQ